jgi:hypothetical protein
MDYPSNSATNAQLKHCAAALIFCLPYVALLFWFHYTDVYHRHFSEGGAIVLANNCLRTIFVFYLFWIIETPGILLLRTIARTELGQLDLLERFAAGFLTGSGIWHVGMFGLGYLNLYTLPAAIVLTVPVVFLSYGEVRTTITKMRRAKSNGESARTVSLSESNALLFGLLATSFFMLFIVKAIHPNGSSDYYTHYFYYFVSVIQHHGIWPNEVWYHYYYDKGAGLTFLGMLLTDPLAPQLVAFCFMAVAALVIFLAARDAAPGTAWPRIAALLFPIIYLYTPGWGQFERTHEFTVALVIGAIWAAGRTFDRCGNPPNRLWPLVACATITSAVIVAPTIALVLGAIFGILIIWYVLARDFGRASFSFAFAATAGFFLLASFVINYVTTGLINDQFVVSTWPFINIEKLNQWGALPWVLEEYWIDLAMAAQRLPLSQAPKLLDQSSRLDLIYPFIDGAIIVALVACVIRLRIGRWSGQLNAPHQTLILLAAVPMFIALALTEGLIQYDSFYRYATFVVPLMLVSAVSMSGLPISDADKRFKNIAHHRHAPVVVFLLCLLTLIIATHPGRFFITTHPDAARFAVGDLSIDGAYTSYPLDETAINPGARSVYAIVGPRTPIWSFQTHYCMLPECVIENHMSFIMPGWPTVMFGSPEEARAALQAGGLNYFLLTLDFPISDSLVWSPLFSPDNISKYLGIRWTDGTTTLLTWRGPDTAPLDEAWLKVYRQAAEGARIVQVRITRKFPYEEMKQIYARLNATPHPWKPFPLPF